LSSWGGVEFLSLTSALNIGFFSFDQFQLKLSWASKRAREVAAAALARNSDSADKSEISAKIAEIIEDAEQTSETILTAARRIALAFGIAAIIGVYFNFPPCSYEFVLILPIPIYLCVTYIRLRRISKACESVCSPSSKLINGTIDSLDKLLEDRKNKDS
jgi:hypothetical protein